MIHINPFTSDFENTPQKASGHSNYDSFKLYLYTWEMIFTVRIVFKVFPRLEIFPKIIKRNNGMGCLKLGVVVLLDIEFI